MSEFMKKMVETKEKSQNSFNTNIEILESVLGDHLGYSPATIKGDISDIRSALRRHSATYGYEPALIDLVTDPAQVERLVRCDLKLNGEGKINKRVMQNLRRALLKFAVSVPPPSGFTRDDLRRAVAEGWRATTHQRGTRYFTNVGTSKRAQPQFVPSLDDIAATIQSLRTLDLKFASTSADMTALLTLTGIRVGAALSLRRSDLVLLPDRRVWAYVHEKSRRHRRPVYVAPQSNELMSEWLTKPAETRLWAENGDILSISLYRRRLKQGAVRAGIPPFNPHDIRKAFAKHVQEKLGIGLTVRAGGWSGTRVLERYLDNAHGVPVR